jgi:WD40 repeat protein
MVLATTSGLRWLDLDVRLPVAYPLRGLSESPLLSSFSADFTRLVTAHGWSRRGRLAGWRVVGGQWERDWVSPDGPISAFTLRVCPTGARCAYVAQLTEWACEVRTRNAATGADEAAGHCPYLHRSVRGLQFRPDGQQVLAILGTALIAWPVPGLVLPWIVRNTSRKHFTTAAYHPNNRYLFTTSNDATATVWDTQTWEPVKQFTWDIGRLKAVALSADGALAAVGSDTGQIVVWDVDL